MKKLIPCILAAFMFLSFFSTQLEAQTPSKTVSIAARSAATTAPASTQALMVRLDEIRAMDFSMLSSSDKRNLRNELRSMKSQFAAIGGGVYISVGAIIVILIVLLILL